ncbi:MAG: GNAT family N-acetyltransferase [Desulfobacteraceae bacterium]|jgi:GNAT superfamily N-acetyltransferase|nr:GNAT family N-acetyltransferase [Desulfobacteraceae bacterium]
MHKLVKALPSEADVLQEIARKSKMYWGYDDEYMKKWKHDQLLTPSFISHNPVFALKDGEDIVGFFAFDLNFNPIDLKHFWIDPKFTRAGVGKALFSHVFEFLVSIEFTEFQVTVEPNATGFYTKMGGKVIGEISRPELEQTYPVMLIQIRKPNQSNPTDS